MATITILGGGVAGLALAATLDPSRHDVTLVERSPGRSLVPTTFGIWPFALEALERIGPAEVVRSRAQRLAYGRITAGCERSPVSVRLPFDELWVIARPTLLATLDEAVPTTVRREERHVDDPTHLPGDLVVAADGARSCVRRHVWGQEPRDTGVLALRGVLEAAPPAPDEMQEFWGAGMLFGVGPDRLADGLATNWYAGAPGVRVSSPEEALAWARSVYTHFPEPVRATLAAARPEQTLVNTVLESRRARQLVRGRYVLVGDAAHAMAPHLGRGACEALVDAVTLGEALNAYGLEGVRAYGRSRLRPPQRTRAAASLARRLVAAPRASRMAVALASRLDGRPAPVPSEHV